MVQRAVNAQSAEATALGKEAAMTAAAQAAEREEDARRREVLTAERAARPTPMDLPEALPGPSHIEPKARPTRPEPSREEQLKHQRWVEEKPIRSAAFDERQLAAHEAAVAHREQAKAAAERELAAKLDMDMQAKLHIVPGNLKFGDVVSDINDQD